MRNFYLYTDASFSNKHQLAVSAYCLFGTSEEHEASIISAIDIHTVVFKESTNIRAELHGALIALQSFTETHHLSIAAQEAFTLQLFTDCQAITQLLARRAKLEATDFISGRKKTVLPHADLYKTFFALYDRLRPKISWVNGHSPLKQRSFIQKNFSHIDKSARNELRRKLAVSST